MIFALFQFQPAGGKIADVARPSVAAAVVIGVARLRGIREGNDLITHIVRAKIIRDRGLARRRLDNANGSAIQFRATGNAGALTHHEPLAVVEPNTREGDAAAVIPGKIPGEAVTQNVDGAGAKLDE